MTFYAQTYLAASTILAVASASCLAAARSLCCCSESGCFSASNYEYKKKLKTTFSLNLTYNYKIPL